MTDFQDSVAVVTGAGTGIGRAVAHGLAAGGARVGLVGRRYEKLRETAHGLDPQRSRIIVCDVSDRPAVTTMAEAVSADFGDVGVLVNNAGMNTNPRTLGDVEPSDWDETVSVNLTGAFNMVRALLPGLRRESGVVVNVASIAGLRASKLAGAAYSASKHGMVALTHTINEEEVAYGMRACAICPGEVATPILDSRPEPVSAQRRAAMLQPEDVASAVLFVASLPVRACVAELIIKPTVQIYQ